MPKTIPCWDCKGRGFNITFMGDEQIKCKPCKGGGVLSVYTQEEVDEVVKKVKETLTLIRHICFTSRSGHYTRPDTEREDILLLAKEGLKDIETP